MRKIRIFVAAVVMAIVMIISTRTAEAATIKSFPPEWFAEKLENATELAVAEATEYDMFYDVTLEGNKVEYRLSMYDRVLYTATNFVITFDFDRMCYYGNATSIDIELGDIETEHVVEDFTYESLLEDLDDFGF